MKRKELTKTFTIIPNKRKLFGFYGFYGNISELQGLKVSVDSPESCCPPPIIHVIHAAYKSADRTMGHKGIWGYQTSNLSNLFIVAHRIVTYSTDFTKWDRFFISGWPALTLASPSLARAQARRDRRRIGCAQRMKWARAPTRFGPGKYTRPNPTWACTQYTVWRLTWML